MTDYTPLSRFRKFISRVSALATEFGNQLQLRGFKTGGTTGQVPRKTGSGNFVWSWANLGWNDVTGKPTSFPPSAHTHPISQVTGLQAALDVRPSLIYVEVTTDFTIQPFGRYILNSDSMITATIPPDFPRGQTFELLNKGLGGIKIAQQAGQWIGLQGTPTTEGVTGGLETADDGAAIAVVCLTEDTSFMVSYVIGTFTIL